MKLFPTQSLFSSLCLGLLATFVVGLSVQFAAAVVPTDQLMSHNTRGFASIPNIEELRTKWNQTQMGHLVKDEAMRPFIDDLKAQLKRKIAGVREKLAIEFSDLRDIAGGEIGLGLVEQENDRAIVSLAVDVTGHHQRLENLLKKVDKDLIKRNAKKDTVDVSGTALTIYDIPPQDEKDIPRTAVYFVHDDMFCACDNRTEAEEMLRRFDGGSNLQSVKAYETTMAECRKESRNIAPQLRWFVDPFGYARAVRAYRRDDDKQRGKDYVAILNSQGFDAIQGAGGYVSFAVGSAYEMLHRTSVYAPPIPGLPEKYELAMRMMDFPNSNNLDAQSWSPRKLACYRTFNINTPNAFENFDTLFDAIAGYEDAFANMLEGLEKDPYGPQVDVRKDFVAHLGQRMTLVTDYQVPITPKCERFLFAIELTNEQAIAATVEKFMNSEENAVKAQFQGKTIWEISEAQEDVEDLEIAVGDLDLLDPVEPALQVDSEEDGKGIPTSAVCVTDGHLFISSHAEFMKEVFTNQDIDAGLAKAGDYREVERALNQLLPGSSSARFFTRTDEAYRPVYELLRQGKMPESETLLGRVLNRLLAPPEEDEQRILREQKIDGRLLPDFEMVRRYFSPAGTIVRSNQNGWFIAGATLSKLSPQARVQAKSDSTASQLR